MSDDDLAARLLGAARGGPDPDGAEARMRGFLAAAGEAPGGVAAAVVDERAERLLGLLVAQAPALVRTLAQEPRRLAALARDPWLEREKPEPVMRAELEASVASAGDLHAGLRRRVREELVRLGARELGFAPAATGEEVARELAHLAGAALDVALDHLAPELDARYGPPLRDDGARCRFVVFGMGKLGGEELNFSSDVDLLYAYETDAGVAGSLTLHEWFSRLAERLSRALGDATADGSCFRVDLRLRPEGTRGPLVNSLPALERYYESWGRPWERQAWVKARAVAGDRDLGDVVLATLEPFVWPRSSAPAPVVREIVRLLEQARRERDTLDDIKVGAGGIREVEFFAQALQLVHGGRNPGLRERGTLRALDKLLFAGLVSEREHRTLGDAYVLLRRVEHRLQLEELRQTQTLPAAPEARALLAARLGYPARDAFELTLAETRARVAEVFATLGEGDGAAPSDVHLVLDPGTTADARGFALARLGFLDLDSAAELVEHLVSSPRSPFAPTADAALQQAAPALFAELAASPDPDLALRRLADLVARRGAGASVWRLMSAHPPLARLLASLFGTSDFLAAIFVGHPELVEPLLVTSAGAPRKPLEEHRRALRERLAFASDDDDDEEARLEALRRYRNEEVLRIGLHDVSGGLGVDEVSVELTALAEACVAATLEVVAPAVARRYGGGPRALAPLAVVAMGKLGGGEMSYSSDLDLQFLFGADDDDAAVAAFERTSRLAARLLHGLGAYLGGGRLYEVDTRLRPSGQRGALVSSVAGFRRYHARAAALWERQALIKARAVAGSAELGRAVEAVVADAVWGAPPVGAREAAQEIGRLRARMERELAQEDPGAGRYNIKSGRGGLVDVEFLVQYLQLVHGPADPSLRARATRPALDALAAAGHVAAADHAQLAASWTFLRRLENRLRIVHDRPIAQLDAAPALAAAVGGARVIAAPDGGPAAPAAGRAGRSRAAAAAELDKLARRLGYREASPGARLLHDYRAHTDAIRAIYARFLPV